MRLNQLCIPLLLIAGMYVFPQLVHAEDQHEATTAGKLGDMSAFKAIAVDTLKLVAAGDLAGAKTRIKDLETDWDNAEEKLKPVNSAKWTSVDKSIDRALANLRSGTPDAKACTTSLETLIAKFDAVDKK